MSKLVHCSVSHCFSKVLVNNEDDVLHLAWSKDTCLSCGSVKYVCNQHGEES